MWFLRYEAWQILFFVILDCFLPFYVPNNPKNWNFEKLEKKKMPGDIIILRKWTKNHDHILYCSWYMARNGCNCYISFWAIFCPFTPLIAQKINILQNEKNHWRYHHFIYVYQKLWSDDVQFLRYGAWRTDRRMDGKRDI